MRKKIWSGQREVGGCGWVCGLPAAIEGMPPRPYESDCPVALGHILVYMYIINLPAPNKNGTTGWHFPMS